jgi:hypothetical protein
MSQSSEGCFINFIKLPKRDLSARGVLVDEGFEHSGELLLLRAWEPRSSFK